MEHDDQLLAVLFDYIERYGLSELARDYFVRSGQGAETSSLEPDAIDEPSAKPVDRS